MLIVVQGWRPSIFPWAHWYLMSSALARSQGAWGQSGAGVAWSGCSDVTSAGKAGAHQAAEERRSGGLGTTAGESQQQAVSFVPVPPAAGVPQRLHRLAVSGCFFSFAPYFTITYKVLKMLRVSLRCDQEFLEDGTFSPPRSFSLFIRYFFGGCWMANNYSTLQPIEYSLSRVIGGTVTRGPITSGVI